MRMQKRKAFILGGCIGLLFLCSGWGFLVHRTINQLAIYGLPKNMQPLFYEQMDYLVKHSIRPDVRRNSDSTEASKHFIDLEAYGDSAAWKMPMRWEGAVLQYSKDSLLKYGYVPYWILEMKQKLTAAFRSGNKDSILFYAADLGHYIGDAHVPLHTSLNYDGQLSGQKGLHSLWESTIPEIELSHYNLYNHHKARYLKKPDEAIWKAVRNAHTLSASVFNEEQEATKDFVDSTKYRTQLRNGREVKSYSTAFARAYAKRLNNTVNQQLLKATALYSDFWYTAWVDAGKPDLKPLLTIPFAGEQKAIFNKQYKAYKQNELLKENLLLSRKTKTDED
jgi:hypothetical protein